jgi:GntR family transcriptional regulator, transcriptional repressor for pyruvate dehydrogenase complex
MWMEPSLENKDVTPRSRRRNKGENSGPTQANIAVSVVANDTRAAAVSSPEGRLRLPKAGELVARNLRNRIIRGELLEGAMLPSEHELGKQFGVSRPTLREAIRILESERLLEITRGLHGGAKVRKPNINVAARYFGFILQAQGTSLADVYRTRVIIEPAAVRILATEQRPETIKKLRDCLNEAPGASKILENALAFSRFHHLIVEETRVEPLILMMGMLNTILDRYLVAVGSVFGQYVQADVETKKATKARGRLIDYIEQGDSDQAAALWRRYLQEAEEKLRRWQPSELVVDLLQNE